MSRHVLILNTAADRQRVMDYARKAPWGSRVEFKAEKRTLDQNSKLWATLTDVATQKEHFGRKYPPEVWKTLFMHGWQRETRMIPSLDGTEVLPLTRTSDLSKEEMSELLEFIVAWSAEQGVVLHDTPSAEAAAA